MERILSLGLIMILSLCMLTGCYEESATVDKQQQAQQEQILQEINNQTGLPSVTSGTEKKNMKRIIEERDNSKLVCYVYTKNTMTGKYILEGKSIGYPLPYATQYTNPEREVNHGSHGQITLPQADPSGLFSPASADATWVMMINEDTGKTEV
jgi:hypothetical protein